MATSVEATPLLPPTGEPNLVNTTLDEEYPTLQATKEHISQQKHQQTVPKTVDKPKNDMKEVNEKKSEEDKGSGDETSSNNNKPKAKIFDNKNYVEAPLPKTNPWTKKITNPDPGMYYCCICQEKYCFAYLNTNIWDTVCAKKKLNPSSLFKIISF